MSRTRQKAERKSGCCDACCYHVPLLCCTAAVLSIQSAAASKRSSGGLKPGLTGEAGVLLIEKAVQRHCFVVLFSAGRSKSNLFATSI